MKPWILEADCRVSREREPGSQRDRLSFAVVFARKFILWLTIFGGIFPAVASHADGKRSVRELKVLPSRVRLTSARDRQGILVLAIAEDGSTSDVTAEIAFKVDRPDIVEYEHETLLPLSDGSVVAELQYQGAKVSLEIEVENSKVKPRLGFRQDILPVLTRAGCNSGKCHGAASGKDGFRLSLFGYDPVGDHYRLTQEMHGRRINLADPANCLLVNKALGRVPHTGGARIDEDGESHAMLLEWLRDGAVQDPTDAAVPNSISVFPGSAVFSQPGEIQKLLVVANYSDGTDRDVTAQTVFFSNNEAAATVSEEGMVSADGPGTAFIMARFDQFTEGTAIIVRPGGSFQFPDLPANNYIDRLVHDRLRDLNVIPSDVVADEPFLRRVYVDLIGQLPSSVERQQFLADSSPQKRVTLVESLVKRREFRDLWAMRWAELLQIRSNNGLSPKGLKLYDEWLRDRVHAGKSIDEIVRELLPASGGTFDNPPTNYFQTETSPQLLAESVAQVFLGTRIQCAQCHNHPFDRWTMDDYYGFASFFSQVGYKQALDPRELTVYNLGEGEIKHPVGERPVNPTFLGGGKPTIPAGQDYRKQLAEWLASSGNKDFARNIANLVWAHFMGVGIVEPTDDFRVSNPPSNPALLDALAEHLVAYQFDIQQLARDICCSRTYQLTVTTNSTNALDHRHFSHARPRRMRAEVLLDCISQVTEARDRLPGLGQGGTALQIPDGPTANYFLTTFGRSTRQSPCSCEVKTNPTLSQALHLLNGETTNGKIKQGHVVARLMANRGSLQTAVDELFHRCLCRDPRDQERQEIEERLRKYEDTSEGLEDLFWALLNSNEFIFNH